MNNEDEIQEIIKKLEYRLCYAKELRLSGQEIKILLDHLYNEKKEESESQTNKLIKLFKKI